MSQRPGNHGRVIPRDAALLSRLYWGDMMTLPEIAERFDVTHKSVERVFRVLGIPTRKRGKESKVTRGCKVCGAPVQKVRHATNGSEYGRLCAAHRREHRNRLAREYVRQPEIHAKRQRELRRWYLEGAKNPSTEDQWITKGRHLLRSARRELKKLGR